MRGLATATDAVVFLLLVTAAVGTLTLAPTSEGPPTDEAAAAARTLSTATTTATYRPVGRSTDRTRHGTPAGLLRDVTLASLTLDGEALAPTGDPAGRAVATAVRRTLAGYGPRLAVRATWEPYPDAPLRGVVAVGGNPPDDADVSAASLTLPSGLGPLSPPPDAGYDGLAASLADRIVATRFAPDRTRDALYAGDERTAVRYDTWAATLGTTVREQRATGDARGANDVLAGALAQRLETDLEERFESPGAARRAIDLTTVRVRVFVW